MSEKLKLGFIGLGIMGAPMAGHLVNAGHDVFVATRSKIPQNILDSSAVKCASPAEVAQKADVIFLMLPDTPDVDHVLFGDGTGSVEVQGCAYASEVADMIVASL